ncbi:LysR family transcriptional regulator [Herbaspirillum chlorophenolicum]|uniref:LysR family transcriptional regulator n=1 Tax=Herbaspirillum chlorophenolicum TaxID=211589 RepID=UPI00067E587B|nr:LysR family transcriptional regulator [Herbaspirillum chlorophenolicum]
MNLRLLGIFRAVMANESTIGAARSLDISQPAVSNAIRQLEEELGFALFDRVGNRLAAREEARVLLKESEAMFLFARKLDDVAEDLKENRVGRVRVTATPQLGHTVLPAAIGKFLASRPKVKVVCDVVDSHQVIESTEALTADFGMAIALEPELSDSLKMVLMTAIEMVCVLPAGHPLANRKTITPKDLRAHPFIALENSARLSPLIRTAFSQAGVPFSPVVEVRYSETACLLARAGAGATVVDWFSASMLPRDGSVVSIPFRPQIMVNVWAIFPRQRPPSRLAYALLEEVNESISRLRDG